MGRLLIGFSGAQPAILDQCPSERAKFAGLGSAVLIVGVLAAVSMWFALAGPLGINGLAALPIAILWGLVILGIERWLIVSLPLRAKRSFLVAFPRLVLALLLGSIVATPVVLRVFQSEINAQVAVIQQQRTLEASQTVQKSAVAQTVTRYQVEITQLQRIVSAGKTSPGYQEAAAALPVAIDQLSVAQQRLSDTEAQVLSQKDTGSGLLIELQGLDQLSAGNSTVAAARLLLFLLFLTITCLPLTVRLLQQPGTYERILAVMSAQEEKRAVWELRQAPGESYQGRPVSLPEDVIRDIWRQRVSAQFGPVNPLQETSYSLATEPQLEPRQSDEHAVGRDELLAVMGDQRDPGDGRNTVGIPLYFDDDDL